MRANGDRSLTIVQRRRAMHLAYWNGAIWAIGNGLASTTLVIYLALDLGAKQIGLGIGLILAMRYVVGVLRLGAPVMIGRLVDRKLFCLGAYLLSAFFLLGIPTIAVPGVLPSPEASLFALVALWSVYHLLQYFGTIALWSWLADLVPLRVRGRFIGRRNRWTVCGEAAAMPVVGLFVWGWRYLHPEQPTWIAYVIPTVLGAGFMIAALTPLLMLAHPQPGRMVRHGATLRALGAPFRDRRFLALILFGCWLSFANGLTQTAQYTFPKNVLFGGDPAAVSLLILLALMTMMRLGQLVVSPSVGRLADRVGNRPVMIVSLLLVAQGPMFYLLSSSQQWWWFAGAWVVWIAYAGLNVCLPNLMLKLAPGHSNTTYIATYFTITGLCYAASTVGGGYLFDHLHSWTFSFFGTNLDRYDCFFLVGWVSRCLGVLLLLFVVTEPTGSKAKE